MRLVSKSLPNRSWPPIRSAGLSTKTIVIVALLTVYAVLGAISFTTAASAATGTSQLTITSQDLDGNTLTGYYTTLNQSSTSVASGFTPYTFTLNNGQSYMVQADNYGSCTFAFWLDNGSPIFYRAVSTVVNMQLVAVYDCNPGSQIIVTAQDQNGLALPGYYITLSDSSGALVGTGFTPASFSTTMGQTYTITAYNYGSCTFTAWSDLGSSQAASNPSRIVTGPLHQTYLAIYYCTSRPSSSVTVDAQDQNGNSLPGYYATFSGPSGNVISSGFTPATFTTTVGATYNVQVSNYGNCFFTHWNDEGSSQVGSESTRAFVATNSPQTFTADYMCTTGTTSTIFVFAVNSEGNSLVGYYIALWQNGAQIGSCFTEQSGGCGFTVNVSQTYQIVANSYGSETFSHWQNDGSTGPETLAAPAAGTTTDLVAVYSP